VVRAAACRARQAGTVPVRTSSKSRGSRCRSSRASPISCRPASWEIPRCPASSAVRTPRPAGCPAGQRDQALAVQVHLTPARGLLTAGHRVQVGPLRGGHQQLGRGGQLGVAGGAGPVQHAAGASRSPVPVQGRASVWTSNMCSILVGATDTHQPGYRVCGEPGVVVSRRRWRASSTTADPRARDRDVVVSTGSTTGMRLARLLNHRRPAPATAMSWSRQARPPGCGWRASSTTADPRPATAMSWSRQARPPGCGWRASSTTPTRSPRPRCRGLDKLDHRGAAGALLTTAPAPCLPRCPWSRQARPPGCGMARLPLTPECGWSATAMPVALDSSDLRGCVLARPLTTDDPRARHRAAVDSTARPPGVAGAAS
jgi:hypothetical protein